MPSSTLGVLTRFSIGEAKLSPAAREIATAVVKRILTEVNRILNFRELLENDHKNVTDQNSQLRGAKAGQQLYRA